MTFAARLAHATNRVFCHTYHTVQITGSSRPPRAGPAIVVCNHVSGLDPMLIQAAISRRIVWMMAREYYEIKALGWFFRSLDAIPVDRTGRDVAATRKALRALKDGNVLGIFPEGRLEPTLELLPFQPGVALFAAKSGAPIYPAYITGTHRAGNIIQAVLRPGEARIRFGEPLSFGRTSVKLSAEADTAIVVESIGRLRGTALSKDSG